MNNLSPAVTIFVLLIAFIAGYAIVSYAVKKFREGREPPRRSKDNDKQ
jgi:F0F1-type ATP synthase assembly protein I